MATWLTAAVYRRRLALCGYNSQAGGTAVLSANVAINELWVIDKSAIYTYQV